MPGTTLKLIDQFQQIRLLSDTRQPIGTVILHRPLWECPRHDYILEIYALESGSVFLHLLYCGCGFVRNNMV